MIRRIVVALLVVALTAPAWALTTWYSSGSSGVSVSQTNAKVQFTFNVSGGTSGAFSAQQVTVSSRSGSANTCFFRLGSSPATTADIALAPGASYSFTFNPADGEGWGYMSAICSTGQTATFDVVAAR